MVIIKTNNLLIFRTDDDDAFCVSPARKSAIPDSVNAWLDGALLSSSSRVCCAFSFFPRSPRAFLFFQGKCSCVAKNVPSFFFFSSIRGRGKHCEARPWTSENLFGCNADFPALSFFQGCPRASSKPSNGEKYGGAETFYHKGFALFPVGREVAAAEANMGL